MKKTRLLSLLCAIAMSLTLVLPVNATYVAPPESNHLGLSTSSFQFEGKTYKIAYDANGVIDHVQWNENITQRIGNEIYLNDVKIATIETEYTTGNIEPRTGWIYGDGSCPEGYTSGDYNKLFDTKSHNITFELAVAECSRDILLATLVLIVPFLNVATGQSVFGVIASTILGHASDFGNDNCVYATEYIYSGGMPYTHKNVFHFYSNSEKTKSMGTSICYSSWA